MGECAAAAAAGFWGCVAADAVSDSTGAGLNGPGGPCTGVQAGPQDGR